MAQNTSSAVMQQRYEPNEEWRPVNGWPGYEVSNLGRVRSWKQRAKGRVWIPDYGHEPRILKADIRNGYPSVLLCDKRAGRKWQSIHRLVLSTFIGPAPDGFQSAHGNGDKGDNRLSNLRWASPIENNADKILHGTHQSGEGIGSSKLTEAQIREIRSKRAGGEKVIDLAYEYKMCRNSITNITHRRTWRNI